MKSILAMVQRCFIRLGWVFLFASFSALSRGEESWQMVVCQMPVKDEPAVRAVLSDPEKAGKPDTIDEVLKLHGVKKLAQFTENDPWQNRRFNLKKPIGFQKESGETLLDLGVEIERQGSHDDSGLVVDSNTDVRLQLGRKEYRCFHRSGMACLPTSRWVETGFWGDAESVTMMWEYSAEEKKSVVNPNPSHRSWQIEIRLYQVKPEDMEVLKKSTPETSEKALQWLSGRATLWKECRFPAMQGNKSVWMDEHGELLSPVNKDKSRFSVEAEFRGKGDSTHLWLDLISQRPRRSSPGRFHMSIVPKPGVWEFSSWSNVPEANLVVYRILEINSLK